MIPDAANESIGLRGILCIRIAMLLSGHTPTGRCWVIPDYCMEAIGASTAPDYPYITSMVCIDMCGMSGPLTLNNLVLLGIEFDSAASVVSCKM